MMDDSLLAQFLIRPDFVCAGVNYVCVRNRSLPPPPPPGADDSADFGMVNFRQRQPNCHSRLRLSPSTISSHQRNASGRRPTTFIWVRIGNNVLPVKGAFASTTWFARIRPSKIYGVTRETDPTCASPKLLEMRETAGGLIDAHGCKTGVYIYCIHYAEFQRERQKV